MMVLVAVVSWVVTRRRREAPCRASTSHRVLPGDETDLAKNRWGKVRGTPFDRRKAGFGRGTSALGSNDTRTWIEGHARGEEGYAHLHGGIRGDRSIDPRSDDRDERSWLEGHAHFHGETREDRSIQVRTWIEGQARGADGSAGIDGSIPALAWIQARSGRRDTRGSMDPSARIDRTICACPVTPSAQGSS